MSASISSFSKIQRLDEHRGSICPVLCRPVEIYLYTPEELKLGLSGSIRSRSGRSERMTVVITTCLGTTAADCCPSSRHRLPTRCNILPFVFESKYTPAVSPSFAGVVAAILSSGEDTSSTQQPDTISRRRFSLSTTYRTSSSQQSRLFFNSKTALFFESPQRWDFNLGRSIPYARRPHLSSVLS